MTHQYLSRTWIDPRQIIQASPIQGLGAFARDIIKQSEAVEIVGGVVLTEAEFRAFQNSATRYNAIQIAEDLHLVEQPELTQMRQGSLNHSCDSNLWLADEVTLVARRDIAAGEELTIDYALFTAQPDWALELPCQCGTPVCRHTITGNDWQIAQVQDRYYPHFSPFINARIDYLRRKNQSQETQCQPL